ncbi:PhlD [Actinacidiphila sp. bgisy144]|uniref:PhlD n=1 Tax=Actinacidiphila sp. bgisy144 TaxID=3413791 RepID=UPI003EC0058C
MAVHVSCPAVALPEHRVPTSAVIADLERYGASGAVLRIVRNLGVEHRYMSRTLAELAEPEGAEARNAATVAAVNHLGAHAAADALHAARLDADEIDAVIAVHSSGVTMPGLGVHLAATLGLRPDALHIPVTQVGCTGGAWSLALAADLVAAQPDRRVLVVVAESLTSSYRPAEPGMVPAMYRALFGDSAAAAVVTAEWRGPGLRVERTWSHLLPDSARYYWMTLHDGKGQHFDSTSAAVSAVAECMPPLVDWLKDAGLPQWVAAHPGGPKIINSVADGLPVPVDLRHSWNSLREHGNTGGPAVLDVLRRIHQAPPPHGARGLVAAFGPGFFASAVTGTWQEHATL